MLNFAYSAEKRNKSSEVPLQFVVIAIIKTANLKLNLRGFTGSPNLIISTSLLKKLKYPKVGTFW